MIQIRELTSDWEQRVYQLRNRADIIHLLQWNLHAYI